MFKKTALAAGIGLALSVTAQADYRWEVGGDYTMGQDDVEITRLSNGDKRSDNVDSDVGKLYGSWYMENVDTSKGPLAEAAFLDHASDITIFVEDGEAQLSQIGNGQLNDEDGQRYGVSSRYVAEGPGWKLSGWLVDLGYNLYEPGDQEFNNYNIGIGNYITPNTTVVVAYDRTDVNNGGDYDSYALELEHMWLLSHGGIKLRSNVGKTVVPNVDDPTTYLGGLTWYFTNNIGIGADWERTSDINGAETDGWNVHSDWFINESFSVNLSYANLDPDDRGVPSDNPVFSVDRDYDEVKLGALFRF